MTRSVEWVETFVADWIETRPWGPVTTRMVTRLKEEISAHAAEQVVALEDKLVRLPELLDANQAQREQVTALQEQVERITSLREKELAWIDQAIPKIAALEAELHERDQLWGPKVIEQANLAPFLALVVYARHKDSCSKILFDEPHDCDCGYAVVKAHPAIQAIPSLIGAQHSSWNESSIEEKIERLRREVQNLRWMLNDVRRRTKTFEEHEHNAKGEVVAPIRSKFSGDEASMRDTLA